MNSKSRFQTKLGRGVFGLALLVVVGWSALAWFVVQQIPADTHSTLKLIVMGAVVVSLVAVYAGAMWLAARLCEPLSELRRRVRSIVEENRWDTTIPVTSRDDFGQLARGVEMMRRAYVRLARTEESKLGRLSVLSRLAGLLDVTGGQRVVAERALEIITRELPLRAGAVYLMGDDERHFELSAQIGLASQLAGEARLIPAHQHLFGHLTRAGQVIVTDAVGAQPWLQAVGVSAELAPIVVAIPLKSGDRLRGAMVLTSAETTLNPEDIDMIASIGNQVGGALDTARAIEESGRRLSHLEGLLATSNEVARSLSEQQVLHVILTKTRELMHVETSVVYRWNESTQQLTVRDSIGLSDEFVRRSAFSRGEGAVGQAVKERRIIAVNDLASAPDYAKLAALIDEARYACVLAAPLVAGDRVLGGIEIYARDRREFTEEEQQLLSIFANQAATAIVNAELHNAAQQRLEALSVLFGTIEHLSATSAPQDIMKVVISEVAKRFPGNVTYVLLENEDTRELEVAVSRGLNSESAKQRIGESANQRIEESTNRRIDELVPIPTPRCWAIKRGRLFEVADDARDFTCAEVITNGPARSYACAPLIASGRAFGVMHMSSSEPNAFTPEQLQLFTTLANHLALALERAQLFQRVEQLAKTDSLTGLANYREFRTRLQDELRRAERFTQPVSLLLADLDNFKSHNDRFGHPSGDAVLHKFADLGRAQIRAVDFFARCGGEEFAIILSNTDEHGAEQVAEKIRAAVEGDSFTGDHVDPIVRQTVSIGIATFPYDANDLELLVQRADEALYQAKQTGRNRVCIARARVATS